MSTDQQQTISRLGFDAYAHHHGMRVVALEPGLARVQMEVPPWAMNGMDVCHGGAIFSLADHAQAQANFTIGREIGMQGNINWLAPAQVGDVLTAEARVLHAGRRTFVTNVEVRNQHGERVAWATFTLARLPDE